MALTDDELVLEAKATTFSGLHPWGIGTTRKDFIKAARAIESAATAPLLARIAELEADVRAAEERRRAEIRSSAEQYLSLSDAMGYHSGKDGLEFSPEEYATKLVARSAALEATVRRHEIALLKAVAPLAQVEQAAQPVDVDTLTDKIASMLGLTYHCTRVWDAWRVGTMSQDDFEPVDESDTPREIAEEIFKLYTAPPKAVPLTRDQVSQVLQSAGYDAASPEENADFINGIRHAEIAHGIGTPATVEKEVE